LFSACGTQGGGFRYAIDEGEITITRYVGFSRNIVIPKEIYGMPVVTIFNEAFRKKGLRSVVIPDSVTEIDAGAFMDNRLTSVVVSNPDTDIGEMAFARNSVKEPVLLFL
jgi:hypothetical protein